MAFHERFRERLARLERCGSARRADDRSSCLREQVRDAETQRQLRTDDREIDILRFCDHKKLRRLREVRVDALGDGGDARVSRRAKHGGNVAFA